MIGWMGFAEETKARINGLRALSSFSEDKLRILRESHTEAVAKHDYPGTMSEWAYIIETFGGSSGNSNGAAKT